MKTQHPHHTSTHSVPHAEDIMSKKLISIQQGTSLSDAYELMKEKNIRHLPVENEHEKIVGILSDRDLQRAMDPSIEPSSPEEITYKFDPAFKVKDFMTQPVRSVSEDLSVREVTEMMLAAKISAVLVVGANSKPRGIVTTDDLLHLLIRLLDKTPGSLTARIGVLFEKRFSELSYWQDSPRWMASV